MSLFHNSHIRKTRCNISIQSMLFSSKLPLSFRTSNQQCKRISLLSHACHLPHPPQPLSLNHSDIQRDLGDKTIKHLIMQFCLPPLTFSPFSQVLPSAFLSYWLKYLEKGNDNNIRKCWSFAFHLSAAKALYTQIFFLHALTNATEPDFCLPVFTTEMIQELADPRYIPLSIRQCR